MEQLLKMAKATGYEHCDELEQYFKSCPEPPKKLGRWLGLAITKKNLLTKDDLKSYQKQYARSGKRTLEEVKTELLNYNGTSSMDDVEDELAYYKKNDIVAQKTKQRDKLISMVERTTQIGEASKRTLNNLQKEIECIKGDNPAENNEKIVKNIEKILTACGGVEHLDTSLKDPSYMMSDIMENASVNSFVRCSEHFERTIRLSKPMINEALSILSVQEDPLRIFIGTSSSTNDSLLQDASSACKIIVKLLKKRTLLEKDLVRTQARIEFLRDFFKNSESYTSEEMRMWLLSEAPTASVKMEELSDNFFCLKAKKLIVSEGLLQEFLSAKKAALNIVKDYVSILKEREGVVFLFFSFLEADNLYKSALLTSYQDNCDNLNQICKEQRTTLETIYDRGQAFVCHQPRRCLSVTASETELVPTKDLFLETAERLTKAVMSMSSSLSARLSSRQQFSEVVQRSRMFSSDKLLGVVAQVVQDDEKLTKEVEYLKTQWESYTTSLQHPVDSMIMNFWIRMFNDPDSVEKSLDFLIKTVDAVKARGLCSRKFSLI